MLPNAQKQPDYQELTAFLHSGGSVLTELLSTSHASTRKSPISALVRSDDNVKALASKGVKGILFRSLDEGDVLERVGSEHDGLSFPSLSFMWVGKHVRQRQDYVESINNANSLLPILKSSSTLATDFTSARLKPSSQG